MLFTLSFLLCARHALQLGGESPLQAWQYEPLADDKGIRKKSEAPISSV